MHLSSLLLFTIRLCSQSGSGIGATMTFSCSNSEACLCDNMAWMTEEDITKPTKPKTNSSVMDPYCKGLRYLKIVGLPIKISNADDGVTATFEDHGRRRKCVINAGEILAIQTRVKDFSEQEDFLFSVNSGQLPTPLHSILLPL